MNSVMEINAIHNGDCINFMRELPCECVDLIVTDPPYLMDYRSNHRKEKFDRIKNDKDSHGLISDYIAECFRILKDNTAIYMFCSWHNIDFFKREFETLFKLKNLIVWEKNNHGSGDLDGSYAPKHELVLFGHKGRHLLKGTRIPDVIHCARVDGNSMIHPTEKPVTLLETFIQNSSDKGDLIFDGFMGSGATAHACLNTGRNYLGAELDSKNINVLNKRLSKTQMMLF